MISRRYLLTSLLLLGLPVSTGFAQTTPANLDKRRFVGNADAKVIVEEYFSATCPHCRTFHLDVFPEIKKEYIDTGRIGWQFRDFPLDRESLLVAKIARCAPEGFYFNVVDLFLRHQRIWRGKNIASIEKIAVEAGFSKETIQQCLIDKDNERKILNEVVTAQKLYRVNSTPSFVINGELQSGGSSITNIRLIISRALRG